MRKHVFYSINLILAIMAGLFAGCRSKRAVSCKYGPPPERYAQKKNTEEVKKPTIEFVNDTLAPQPQDTVPQDLPPVPDIPVCKYGPPGGEW